ncbi:hypothetical protein HOD19_00020 [bacterium]|jgi:hypothetical protein|nr:hypothetical protein [bacterium]MBT4649227.1 hypothetical protein [bacterium]
MSTMLATNVPISFKGKEIGTLWGMTKDGEVVPIAPDDHILLLSLANYELHVASDYQGEHTNAFRKWQETQTSRFYCMLTEDFLTQISPPIPDKDLQSFFFTMKHMHVKNMETIFIEQPQ